ncbi:hypothetical protein PCAR4_830117 [Paraburkholderia caribensis]|nr:hypothetical protein PCAR4_830117 [Paraburkholderia caribensis]
MTQLSFFECHLMLERVRASADGMRITETVFRYLDSHELPARDRSIVYAISASLTKTVW